MAKYRKKPVVIEAWCNTEESRQRSQIPHWLIDAGKYGKVMWSGANRGAITIKTLEGDMRADYGDWIICGVAGEIYPCKPDIFSATYEPAE